MQEMVKNFMRDCPQHMTVETCMLDVVSEAGELSKEVNISNSWGRYDDNKFRENAKVEAGQLLFAVLQIISVMGENAESLLEATINEYRARYKVNGHTGSSTYIVAG